MTETEDKPPSAGCGRLGRSGKSLIDVFVAERLIVDEGTGREAGMASIDMTSPRLNASLHLSGVRSGATRSKSDWYDAFKIADGRMVICIGDVDGTHGVETASTAAIARTVREAIRNAALNEVDIPSMLSFADRHLREAFPNVLVACFLGIVDENERTIRYVGSTELEAVIVSTGGVKDRLTLSSTMLGDSGANWISEQAPLPDIGILVLYTRGLALDALKSAEQLDEIFEHQALLHAQNPAAIVHAAISPESKSDDAVILTMTFGRGLRWAFDTGNARSAHGARRAFVEYLRSEGAEGNFEAAELIFGELIGNVMRHAPGPIDVGIEWDGDDPVLHVIDQGPGFDLIDVPRADLERESGRGIFIVASLGRDLRVERLPGRGAHTQVGLPVRRWSTTLAAEGQDAPE